MVPPFGPRERRGPGLGASLDWVGTTGQQQFDQGHVPPAARPPERRALEEFIADVGARTRIQQHGRQGHAHAMVPRDHFVQHRLARLRRLKIGIAPIENQPERRAAVGLFDLVQVAMPGQRTPEQPEPSVRISVGSGISSESREGRI